MTTELENALARELREVADGVEVPSMPALVADPPPAPRASSLWRPLLVAAVVALVVGVAALVLTLPDDGSPQPTPPAPTQATDPAVPRDTDIRTTMPTVPFIVDGRLYVDGAEVPGDGWWGLQSHEGVWVATQGNSGAWWWGSRDVDAKRIEAQLDQPPVLSPNGSFVAFVDVSSGRAQLTGFTTEPGGEGFGSAPITDLPRTEDGVAIRVRAVTDGGDVIVQGARTSLMWRTMGAGKPTILDLADGAPDQVFLQGTSVGLVVVDGSDGAVDATETEPHLALVDLDGKFSLGPALPRFDSLEVSPGGGRLLWTPPGTLGGEVSTITSLRTRPVSGGDEVVLDAPDGWGFAVGSWIWEDERTVVAALVADGVRPAKMQLARCDVDLGACRAFPAPEPEGETTTDAPRSFTAAQTLDAVIEAAATGDRGSLVDQSVVDDVEWGQLVDYAAGQGGSVGTCRDNGEGTQDCEIVLDADPATTYYAIVTPGENGYGWRVSYVGIGGA